MFKNSRLIITKKTAHNSRTTMVFRAITDTQQPAYWSATLPKAAPAPLKLHLKYPFMLECKELCNTEEERHIFEKAL